MGNPKLPPRVCEGIFWKYCDFLKQDTETILYCSKLLIFLQWCRQAQTILAHREQWAAELAKQIATLPNEIRTFVEKPASDLCLLEGLTACLSGAAAAAPAEDLSTPAPAKVASQAASAPSSDEDYKDRFTQISCSGK